MTINEKLDLWAKISGVDPEQTSFTIKMNGHLGSWDIKEMHSKIKKCLEQDVDGFMTNILLRKFAKELLNDRSFTVAQMIENTTEVTEYIADCKKLLGAVRITKEEIQTYNELQEVVTRFGYQYDLPDVENDDFMYSVCMSKLSVISQIDKLTTAQFRKGQFSLEEPKLIMDIYLFTSIDQLIQTVNSMRNVIFLSLIRDTEDASSSFFAYCIKNGENVFIVSDTPKRAHPMQKHMSRTPGRAMYERMNGTLFPYSLVNVELSKYAVDDKALDGLENSAIGNISDLPYDELIWNIFMIQKLEERFFKQKYQCEELSYTGHMIASPLLETSSTELAIYKQYEKLTMPILQSLEETEDIVFDYDYKVNHSYDDYIDRLGGQISVPDLQRFDSDVLCIPKDTPWYEEKKVRANTILSMPTNDFGTREELENRQKWIVRYNYALELKRLAEKEFEDHNQEVSDWFLNMLKKNYKELIDRVLKDDIKGKVLRCRRFMCVSYTNSKTGEEVSLSRCKLINNYDDYFTRYHVWNQRSHTLADYTCALSGDRATIELQVFPSSAEDIANLFSIPVSDLPVYIQTLGKARMNEGNHLLNNCDPMGFVMEDIWYKEMNFAFSFFLSKKAYNERRKEMGLEPNKFWLGTQQKKKEV